MRTLAEVAKDLIEGKDCPHRRDGQRIRFRRNCQLCVQNALWAAAHRGPESGICLVHGTPLLGGKGGFCVACSEDAAKAA